uniref:Uncharacterized protein n=1 Tax=Oryza punctata TaxID=4537 RepID=A0A0E0KZB8_ORYPU
MPARSRMARSGEERIVVEKPVSGLLGQAEVETVTGPRAETEAATRPWAETVPDTLELAEVEAVAALRVEIAADSRAAALKAVRSDHREFRGSPIR